MWPLVSILAVVFLAGCEALRRPEETAQPEDDTSPPDDTSTPPTDSDGDGVEDSFDCSPNNVAYYQLLSGYRDADGDGYTLADEEKVCSGDSLREGYQAEPSDEEDCDDTDTEINPGAEEVCNDFTDNNCDGGAPECELSGEMSLADADLKLEGSRPEEEFGYSLAPAGDVDGSGYPDVLVGIRYLMRGSDETGGVKIISGGLATSSDFGKVLATLWGETDGDEAGYAVSPAGDQNGDGYDDFWVGANEERSGGDDAGATYLVLGPVSGTVSLATSAAKLIGGEGDSTAYSVAGGADVDGDSVDDVLIGAPAYDSSYPYARGGAYLKYGPVSDTVSLPTQADAFLAGASDVDYAGWSVALGDVNGDGFADAVIGASNNMDKGAIQDWGNPSWYIGNGAVYVKHGPLSGNYDLAVDADATLLGETVGERAGYKLDVGDEDGDGNADLLIGAPIKYGDGGEQGTGATYLVHGPLSGDIDLADAETEFTASYAYAYIGAAVAFAGDMNGDGYMDIALGGSDTTDRGTSYLCYGPFPSGTVDVDIFCEAMAGENESDYAGFPTSGVGDLNQDGFDDLMTGAIAYQEGQFKGATYVIRGRGM